jgi:hypothetical protein
MSPKKRKRADPVTRTTANSLSVPELEALLQAAKAKMVDTLSNKRPRKPSAKAAALTTDDLEEPEETPALVQLGHKVEGRKIKGDEVSVPPVP